MMTKKKKKKETKEVYVKMKYQSLSRTRSTELTCSKLYRNRENIGDNKLSVEHIIIQISKWLKKKKKNRMAANKSQIQRVKVIGKVRKDRKGNLNG